MSTSVHPVTGVSLNAMPIRRTGRLTDAERRTANLLIAAGEPRWLAAAMLGAHPLAVNRETAPRRKAGKPPRGKNLRLRDARSDPRQLPLLP